MPTVIKNIIGPKRARHSITMLTTLWEKLVKTAQIHFGVRSDNDIVPRSYSPLKKKLFLLKNFLARTFVQPKQNYGAFDVLTLGLDPVLSRVRERLYERLWLWFNQRNNERLFIYATAFFIIIPIIPSAVILYVIATAAQIALRAAQLTATFALTVIASPIVAIVNVIAKIARNYYLNIVNQFKFDGKDESLHAPKYQVADKKHELQNGLTYYVIEPIDDNRIATTTADIQIQLNKYNNNEDYGQGSEAIMATNLIDIKRRHPDQTEATNRKALSAMISLNIHRCRSVYLEGIADEIEEKERQRLINPRQSL